MKVWAEIRGSCVDGPASFSDRCDPVSTLKFGVVALVTYCDTVPCWMACPGLFAKKNNGMEYFIGIDVSSGASAVCVVNLGGTVMKEAKVLSEPDALFAFVRGLGHDVSCSGMEAEPRIPMTPYHRS